MLKLKNKLGFTLVELLVVTVIIVLISSSGVFYFANFAGSYGLNTELNLVNEEISSLDDEINSREIYDYEARFKSGSLLFYSYKNFFDIDSYQEVGSLDYYNGSGSLVTNSLSGEIWNFKIYNGYKFREEEFLSSTDIYNFDFSDKVNYKLSGTLSGSTLNDIELNYFSETNLDKDMGDYLELIGINTMEDKSGISITDLIVRNIYGRKTIIGDGSEYNEVYLFFQRGSYEESIKLSK